MIDCESARQDPFSVEPGPRDGREQILQPTGRVRDVDEMFGPLRRKLAVQLEGVEAHQLTAIAEFLTASAECALEQAALLRAQARSGATAVTVEAGS
jgi:hypothetical protein